MEMEKMLISESSDYFKLVHKWCRTDSIIELSTCQQFYSTCRLGVSLTRSVKDAEPC